MSDGGGTGMMTVRGAMFLGVGGTAGAGIFALLGALDAIWKRRRKAPDAAALPHPS